MTFKHILKRWINKQAINFENNRFGVMAIYMITQSCIAAIAAMYILQSDAPIICLCITTALAMANNAVLIAQGSAKICLLTFYLSILANILFILFYI